MERLRGVGLRRAAVAEAAFHLVVVPVEAKRYKPLRLRQTCVPRGCGPRWDRRLGLRQRDGRVALRHPRAETGVPPGLAHAPRTGDGGLLLQRRLLQDWTTAQQAGPQPR